MERAIPWRLAPHASARAKERTTLENYDRSVATWLVACPSTVEVPHADPDFEKSDAILPSPPHEGPRGRDGAASDDRIRPGRRGSVLRRRHQATLRLRLVQRHAERRVDLGHHWDHAFRVERGIVSGSAPRGKLSPPGHAGKVLGGLPERPHPLARHRLRLHHGPAQPERGGDEWARLLPRNVDRGQLPVTRRLYIQ